MTVHKRWLVVVVLLASLLLAACGGSGAGPAAGEGGEGSEGAAPAATNTAAATATPVPSPTPEVTMSLGEVVSVQEVDEINSFRMRMVLQAMGEAFEEEGGGSELPGGEIVIEAEFIKEPLAQRILMNLGGEEGAMLGNIEVVRIGDTVYTNFGGQWIEAPADNAPDVDEFMIIKPQDIKSLENMEEVGREEVNGRNTIHYRGDKEALATLGDEELDVSDVEEAELNLWIDAETGFVVRMTMDAAGTGINDEAPDLFGNIYLELDYTDFNEDFTIEAPEQEAQDLSELLGIDIEFPEGAEVELSMPGFVQAVFPMELADVQAYFEETLTDAGFELNVEDSFPDAGLYVFDAGTQRITVSLTEAAGSTSVILTTEEIEE